MALLKGGLKIWKNKKKPAKADSPIPTTAPLKIVSEVSDRQFHGLRKLDIDSGVYEVFGNLRETAGFYTKYSKILDCLDMRQGMEVRTVCSEAVTKRSVTMSGF